MADFSNYSMMDCLHEWQMDRQRAPLLLKAAFEKSETGVEGVIAGALELGCPRGTIVFALQRAGIYKAALRPADADPFRSKVEQLYRKNSVRLIAIIEELHANG